MPLSATLIKNIKKNKKSTFGMTGNNIRKKDIEELCKLLTENENIVAITLRENQLTDDGVTLLAKHLPERITSVDLAQTDISNKGVAAILQNTHITHLVLSRNSQITNEVATLFESAGHVISVELQDMYLLSSDTGKQIQQYIQSHSQENQSSLATQPEQVFGSPISQPPRSHKTKVSTSDTSLSTESPQSSIKNTQ